MKSFFKSEYFVFTFLFIILIYITVLQSTHQDFTSIIDFDLTVIHNSLQIVSNEFQIFKTSQLIPTFYPTVLYTK